MQMNAIEKSQQEQVSKSPQRNWKENERRKQEEAAVLLLSKKITTHPWSTPKAIPLPNYERIPFTTYW